MKTILTVTRYNLWSLGGWCSLGAGFIGLYLHFSAHTNNRFGVVAACVGIVAGGIMVTLAGPLKTKAFKEITLKELK